MKTISNHKPAAAAILALCSLAITSIGNGASASDSPSMRDTPPKTSETAGQYIDDSTITAKVKAALVSDDSVKATDIQVVTEKGVVQLSGFVDSSAQKKRAATLAKSVEGVQKIQNHIEVKSK